MERSSPLAAMRPPPPPTPWNGYPVAPEYLAPTSHIGQSYRPGQASFNFRDLSMKNSSAGYFTLGPMRGSSPTASLAADLSQNFHIDQSYPHLAGRFSPLIYSQLSTGVVEHSSSNLVRAAHTDILAENVVTPPLPSSSPGPSNDSMDFSPLPHKAPFFHITEVAVNPPTPNPLSSDSMILSSPSGSVAKATNFQVPNSLVERRKSMSVRPQFHRMKGYSTNCIKANNTDIRPPPFRFGTTLLPSTESTTLSLGECFASSPPQERKPPSAAPMFPSPQPRPPLFRLNSNTRIGTSVNSMVKKPLPSQARPRKQFRRSLSMFEHPEDVLRAENRSPALRNELHSIMDVDESYILRIPHFIPTDRPESLPRISKDTLIDVLDGTYNQQYRQVVVIDCRFEYEFQGGHIRDAINYNDKEMLSQDLFGPDLRENTLLVLHCEYSVHRAPIMAKFIREQDRNANAAQYPKLTYPEMYILDGGYKAFFTSYESRCYPQNYVEMDDKQHIRTCEREMGRLRHNGRGKLYRAKTFAFGQQPIDSSPTGQRNEGQSLMMGCSMVDDNFDSKRLYARRMASY
ncbi:MAG: cell division cycle- protein [Vezdaea aestivalis]|nr:MAG: cell division cycle- protein [Vezdaea aestivalis]